MNDMQALETECTEILFRSFNEPGHSEEDSCYFILAIHPETSEDTEVARFGYVDEFTKQQAYNMALAFSETMNDANPK